MASLTSEEKSDECVSHALEVRSSWALANFRRFFRLYNQAPRMSAHLISWFADRERKIALKTLIKAYVFSSIYDVIFILVIIVPYLPGGIGTILCFNEIIFIAVLNGIASIKNLYFQGCIKRVFIQ